MCPLRCTVNLLDPALAAPGQVVEHSAEVLLDFPEDRFLPVVRYENYMIFAIPCGMVHVMLRRFFSATLR